MKLSFIVYTVGCALATQNNTLPVGHVGVYNEKGELKWSQIPSEPRLPEFDEQGLQSFAENPLQRGIPSWKCMSAVVSTASAFMSWWGTKNVSKGLQDEAKRCVEQLQTAFKNPSFCNESIFKTYSGNYVCGAWVGKKVQNNGFADTMAKDAMKNIESQGIPNGKSFEICVGASGETTAGIAIDLNGNYANIDKSITEWSKGNCLNGYTGYVTWTQYAFWKFVGETKG